MTTMRVAAAALFVATVTLGVATCGLSNIPNTQPTTPTTTADPSASTGSASSSQESLGTIQPPGQENDVRIEIRISGQRFLATLDGTAASRDLIAQLPVTLKMMDHGGVEKTGALPLPLSMDGQPAGADPDVGDVGYYAPGNDFVLYYGDQSYYQGIAVLGHMEGDAAERIADMDGSITATIAPLPN
jgi:hypothetical protein